MPDGSATPRKLSESLMCRLADVNRQTRRRWLKAGLLSEREDYGLVDLLELVVCNRLTQSLGPSDGRDAWLQVRGLLRRQLPNPSVDVVFSVADHHAQLVSAHADLIAAVRHGRPVRVVQVGEEMRRVQDALERYRSTPESAPAVRSRVRRERSKKPQSGHGR
jgi:hypothetical protein